MPQITFGTLKQKKTPKNGITKGEWRITEIFFGLTPPPPTPNLKKTKKQKHTKTNNVKKCSQNMHFFFFFFWCGFQFFGNGCSKTSLLLKEQKKPRTIPTNSYLEHFEKKNQ